MKRVQALADAGQTTFAAVDALDDERGDRSMPAFHADLQRKGPRRTKKATATPPAPASADDGDAPEPGPAMLGERERAAVAGDTPAVDDAGACRASGQPALPATVRSPLPPAILGSSYRHSLA